MASAPHSEQLTRTPETLLPKQQWTETYSTYKLRDRQMGESQSDQEPHMTNIEDGHSKSEEWTE